MVADNPGKNWVLISVIGPEAVNIAQVINFFLYYQNDKWKVSYIPNIVKMSSNGGWQAISVSVWSFPLFLDNVTLPYCNNLDWTF